MRPVTAILVALLAVAMAAPAVAAEPQPVTFGIVPQQSATRLAAIWGPLLTSVSARSGIWVQFKTAPDIPEFEKRLAGGEYDVAYMNPYHYTVFHQAPGYRAIARERDRRIQGIIVVPVASDIRDITGLAGQTLAFPAPAAFAASLLPRAALRRNGIDVTPRYVVSHDSVYLGVAEGLFPAGGGIVRTFDVLPPETRSKLRILWQTDFYSPHAIAAHPRVDEETVRRLTAAMVALAQDADGRELLKDVGFAGVEPATDADWDDIRSLQISPSDAGGL